MLKIALSLYQRHMYAYAAAEKHIIWQKTVHLLIWIVTNAKKMGHLANMCKSMSFKTNILLQEEDVHDENDTPEEQPYTNNNQVYQSDTANNGTYLKERTTCSHNC